VSASAITWIITPGPHPWLTTYRGEMAGAWAEAPVARELLDHPTTHDWVDGEMRRYIRNALVDLLGHDPMEEEPDAP